jgi:flagellar export protein FliJ
MPHRFTLAPVLKLRESIEERELHLLEQTQNEISHLLQVRETLSAQQESTKQKQELCLSRGVRATDLVFLEQTRTSLHMRQATLDDSLAALRERRKQQLANYTLAKKKREVLSELRDCQREAYEANAARRQQRITDDSFLARSRQR